MQRLIILAALLALSLLGCNRGPSSDQTLSSRQAPSFITSTGKFKVFGGQSTVTVVETQNGGINYAITRGTTTAGPADPLIRKGSAWAIYPASPDAVWMYDGEKNVLLIEFSDKGSKFTSLDVVPDLLQKAPPAFLERLPARLKDEKLK